MENEHGSVRETNCLQENCNDGKVEEKEIIKQQQPQVIRLSMSSFLLVLLHRTRPL